MRPERRKQLACAVYTRKSSEEGLEQGFNSLHAQREACEAFITSQRHEGWRLLRDEYDDGGFSGGTLERPALQRLLNEISAGRIDVVVVYKVDRLTRSLADFAKIVELFDRQGVSFVSVTQQFNTTSSMGRLTLNVLLSFAQFEREVTGERIRDKIAASRRKGLWMGGNVPLGYDAVDRKLVINVVEAELVRRIYGRYTELRCVTRLKTWLDAEGLRSKLRVRADGRRSGGRPFERGALYALLQNRVYIGEAVHKGAAYPGDHAPIIDRALWDEVQVVLAGNRVARANGSRASEPSLLTGLVFDADRLPMSPSHAAKGGKRYRYYVSQAAITGPLRRRDILTRVPAHEVETAVRHLLRDLLGAPERLAEHFADTRASAADREYLMLAAQRFTGSWEAMSLSDERAMLRKVISTVSVRRGEIAVDFSRRHLRSMLFGEDEAGTEIEDEPLSVRRPAVLKRSGLETRLILAGGRPDRRGRIDVPLVKAVARAHVWVERLLSGGAPSFRAIAREEGLPERYVSRLAPLAFLAPDIVQAILEGRQPETLCLDDLEDADLPLGWNEQRRKLGFGRVEAG
jgi:site-specific DNA recombinase